MGWVMKLKLLSILVAILGWVPPTGAGADTLFQSIPDLTANPVVNAYCSPCYGRGGGPLFDTFILGSTSTVNSISFDILGNYGFPNVDVGIWTVTGGGLPGSQLFSQTFAPAQFVSAVSTVFGTVVVTVDPTALVLSSGTYDISFFNRGGVQTLGVPGYSGGSGMLYDQGYSFISGQSAGFNLSGSATPAAVPLHPSIASELIGLGLFGLLAWRRKRNAA